MRLCLALLAALTLTACASAIETPPAATFAPQPAAPTAPPSLAALIEEGLQAASRQGPGLIDEYAAHTTYAVEDGRLQFLVSPKPADAHQALLLSMDLMFLGARAAQAAGQPLAGISVTCRDSEDVWLRFSMDGAALAEWAEGISKGSGGLSAFFEQVHYETSEQLAYELFGDWATPTPPPPAGVVVGDLQCIPFEEAAQHIGETTCVYGEVVRTYDSERASFVDFDETYSSFYLVSFTFQFEAMSLEGRCLAASGEISTYKGRPQIIIEDVQSQLHPCE